MLITGPPGIGKTTSAHLCAKLEGFTPIEMNASDARSKKLVEVSNMIHKVESTSDCTRITEWHEYQQHLIRWIHQGSPCKLLILAYLFPCIH